MIKLKHESLDDLLKDPQEQSNPGGPLDSLVERQRLADRNTFPRRDES